MPFGTGTVVTTKGKAFLADRLQTTPTTYTVSPKFCAMGVGATSAARTAAAADTALSSEVETRTTGTTSNVTTTTTNDSYQCVGTITATAGRSVDEFGLFDASSVGNMAFSATFPVVSLSSGDGIQFTAKIQIT
jgi:hypothetical protein